MDVTALFINGQNSMYPINTDYDVNIEDVAENFFGMTIDQLDKRMAHVSETDWKNLCEAKQKAIAALLHFANFAKRVINENKI